MKRSHKQILTLTTGLLLIASSVTAAQVYLGGQTRRNQAQASEFVLTQLEVSDFVQDVDQIKINPVHVAPIGVDEAVELLEFDQIESRARTAAQIAQSDNLYEVQSIESTGVLNIEDVGRIHMIGVRYPQPRECFYDQARGHMLEQLEGQQVRIAFDTEYGELDNRGILLGYVYLESGELVGQASIEQGFATSIESDHRLYNELQRAHEQARESQLGLWSPDTCGGRRFRQINSGLPQEDAPREISNTADTTAELTIVS